MTAMKPCIASVGELVRDFPHYSQIAQDEPVLVTENGHPKHVLISIGEYERLKTRDQQAFSAADTPEEFLADIERLASGEGR